VIVVSGTHFAPRPEVATALNQNVQWPRATLPAVWSLAAVGARIEPWRQLAIGIINGSDSLAAPHPSPTRPIVLHDLIVFRGPRISLPCVGIECQIFIIDIARMGFPSSVKPSLYSNLQFMAIQ
jgi:hypothetical protein